MTARSAVATALVASVAAATMTATGVAQAAEPKLFDSLEASAAAAGVGSHSTFQRLELLRREDFQLVRRTSRSSITVGYPATATRRRGSRRVRVRANPCARSTFRLSVAVGTLDPLATVRGLLANADAEGTETYTLIGQRVMPGTVRRAWRIDARFDLDSALTSAHGVSVEQLLPDDPFGPPFAALRTLTMNAKVVRSAAACGGEEAFTVGPGVYDTIKLG